ncbi:phage head closure protein [Providencia stuartii]
MHAQRYNEGVELTVYIATPHNKSVNAMMQVIFDSAL